MTVNSNQLDKFKTLKSSLKSFNLDSFINDNLDDFLDDIFNKISDMNMTDRLLIIEANLDNLENVSSSVFKEINSNSELKKHILSYVFWKYYNYKLKHTSKTISATVLRKHFGITDFIGNHIHHMYYNINCSLCGEEGNFTLLSRDKMSKKFECPHCGHIDITGLKDYNDKQPYIYCQCESCINVRIKLRETYKKWLSTSLYGCKLMIEKYIKQPQFPTYIEMKNDYVENSEKFCNYKDKQFDCITNVIKDLSKLKFSKLEEYYSNLDKIIQSNIYDNNIGGIGESDINEILCDHKVLYEYQEPREIDEYELLFRYMSHPFYFGQLPSNINYHNAFDHLFKLIDDENFFDYCTPFSNIKFKIESVEFSLNNFNPDNKILDVDKGTFCIDELEPHCYIKKLILNPFFFNSGYKALLVNNVKHTYNFDSYYDEYVYKTLYTKFAEFEGYSVKYNINLEKFINIDIIFKLFNPYIYERISDLKVKFLILKNDKPYIVYDIDNNKYIDSYLSEITIKEGSCLISGIKFKRLVREEI